MYNLIRKRSYMAVVGQRMEPSEIISRKEVFLELNGEGLKAAEIEKALAGSFTVRLDGSAVKNKRDLLAALAAGLRFPAYFGGNWDALLDCLRSLPDLVQAPGYAVIIERSDLFLKDSPADLKNFRNIAETAAAFLSENYKLPLRIIAL